MENQRQVAISRNEAPVNKIKLDFSRKPISPLPVYGTQAFNKKVTSTIDAAIDSLCDKSENEINNEKINSNVANVEITNENNYNGEATEYSPVSSISLLNSENEEENPIRECKPNEESDDGDVEYIETIKISDNLNNNISIKQEKDNVDILKMSIEKTGNKYLL